MATPKKDNNNKQAGSQRPSDDAAKKRRNEEGQTRATTGRTLEAPGQPGMEKDPNRTQATGPGGQRLTSNTKSAGREANVEGVDKPDGINQIDANGETTAEETKLL